MVDSTTTRCWVASSSAVKKRPWAIFRLRTLAYWSIVLVTWLSMTVLLLTTLAKAVLAGATAMISVCRVRSARALASPDVRVLSSVIFSVLGLTVRVLIPCPSIFFGHALGRPASNADGG